MTLLGDFCITCTTGQVVDLAVLVTDNHRLIRKKGVNEMNRRTIHETHENAQKLFVLISMISWIVCFRPVNSAAGDNM